MSLELSKKALAVKPSSTLAISAKAKELKAKGYDIVSFGAGEPDFNTPDNINEAAIRAIKEGFTKYTAASGMPELKKAICKKFESFNNINYTPEQIVISSGCKHSLCNICQALINPGDEVIIPSPYWLSYPELVSLAYGVPVFVECREEDGYKITPELLQNAITDKTKAVIINSPNNPTGMVYSRDELTALSEVIIKNDIYCISDEIYENLVYDESEVCSIASLNEEIYKRTITVSGVSKSYAMTGWRIGYTGSSVEIAKLMSNIQSHQTSNPNSIAQKATIEALNGPQDEVVRMKRHFNERRKLMIKMLSTIPHMKPMAPQGAFYVFVDISEVLNMKYKGEKVGDVFNLARILLEDFNVAVIPCADFGFSDHIRLAYAISKDAIEKGLARIWKFACLLE